MEDLMDLFGDSPEFEPREEELDRETILKAQREAAEDLVIKLKSANAEERLEAISSAKRVLYYDWDVKLAQLQNESFMDAIFSMVYVTSCNEETCSALKLLSSYLQDDMWPIVDLWRPRALSDLFDPTLTLASSYTPESDDLTTKALETLLDILYHLLMHSKSNSSLFDLKLDVVLQGLLRQPINISIVSAIMHAYYGAIIRCQDLPERTAGLFEDCLRILESQPPEHCDSTLWLLSTLFDLYEAKLTAYLPRLSDIFQTFISLEDTLGEPLVRLIFIFAKVGINTNSLLEELESLLGAVAPFLTQSEGRNQQHSICWHYRNLFDEVGHDAFFKLKIVDDILYEIHVQESPFQCEYAWQVIRYVAANHLPRVAPRPYFLECFARFIFDSLTSAHLDDLLQWSESLPRLVISDESDLTSNPVKDYLYATIGPALEAKRPFPRLRNNRITFVEKLALRLDSLDLTAEIP